MSHTDAAPSPATGPVRTVHGACNLCEAICGVTFQVQGEGHQARILSVRGNPLDPLSRGHICPKAVALKDIHEDPDRLRQPVKRVMRDGQVHWQPIGWDEAMDLVVEQLARVREKHGANAVATYQGNPNVHNWGCITHGLGFVSALKTRNRFSATSADQLPHQLMAHWLYGHQFHMPIPDVDRTQYMLILGGNPLASNGSIMTVPDVRNRFKALRERGGKLVVIDPRRTETAAVATEHHFIDPGTDAFWLLALIHTLFAEELVAPGPWEAITDGIRAVRDLVAPFSPEAVAASTGIDAATTRRIAKEFAQCPQAVVYGRMGVSTQAHGVVCQWAVHVLNLLTGNLDREGGAMLTSPAVDFIKLGLIGAGHFDVWRSRVRQAPEFAGELPSSVMAEEMLTPGKGQIRGFVTIAGNPVLSTSNGRQLDEALAGLDFMVSIDFYINETTRHAHVILPPTCFVEHDHYDLVFLHLAVRNMARYNEAVVAPQPGQLHDWQIFAELTQRYMRRTWALDRGGILNRLGGLLGASFMRHMPPHRLLALALLQARQGLSLGQLRRKPQGIDLGALKPKLLATLNKRGRRVKLLPDLIAQELRALPDLLRQADAVAAETEAGALKLIGRRDVRSNNSWMHNSPRLVSGKPRCTLLMHPTDALLRGLVDGQTVQVASRVGQVDVPLQVSDDVRPGVVSLPHGWGHGREGVKLRVAQAHAGVSINDLTDDRLTERISANAAFSAVPVWVQAA
jgi:anaerobic selenocysteine-containing dehydrogenase